jgi:hypothetical protein
MWVVMFVLLLLTAGPLKQGRGEVMRLVNINMEEGR